MDTFKSRGRLRYGKSTYWLVLDCDLNICKYYCYLYYISTHKTKKLQLPQHGAHITVNAGKYDVPPNLSRWLAREGEVIEFTYGHNVKNEGDYWWLEVQCPYLSEIRKELGLSPKPFHPFHLTIGNTKFE